MTIPLGFLATQATENTTIAVDESLNVVVAAEDALNEAILMDPDDAIDESVIVGAPVAVHATAVAGINYVGWVKE